MIFLLFTFVHLASVLSIGEKCIEEWEKIINSATNSSIPAVYSLMFQYSGFTMNNLGSYDSCNKIDIARYTVFVYSEIPVLVQTFCGPISCTESDYSNFSPLF